MHVGEKSIPQEFKDASIIHLNTRKGNPFNLFPPQQPIKFSVLSIAVKILAKILLNRLNVHLDQTGHARKSVCVQERQRVNIHDLYSTVRQLKEKCQEQNLDLYMTFVNLTKAFDTVSRDGL